MPRLARLHKTLESEALLDAVGMMLEQYIPPMFNMKLLTSAETGDTECVVWHGSGNSFRCQRFTLFKCEDHRLSPMELVQVAERRMRFWFNPPPRFRRYRKKQEEAGRTRKIQE